MFICLPVKLRNTDLGVPPEFPQPWEIGFKCETNQSFNYSDISILVTNCSYISLALRLLCVTDGKEMGYLSRKFYVTFL